MKQRTHQDEIDRELSRIFFRDNTAENQTGNKEKNFSYESDTNKHNKKIKFSTAKTIILSSAIFLIILIAFVLFQHAANNKKPDIKTEADSSTVMEKSLNPIKSVFLSQKEKSASRKTVSDNIKNAETLYSFENDLQGWEIPLWAEEKRDHVAVSLNLMEDFSSGGNNSMELTAVFPGGSWHGALVEIQQYLNLTDCETIAADIYIPENAPQWLRGKIILTTGKTWTFTEMMRGTRLEPGTWTTVSADMSEKSNDWKKTIMSEEIKSDVRKIAIRIESDKTAYSGPIYIDNIRLVMKPYSEPVKPEKAEQKNDTDIHNFGPDNRL